MDWEHKNSQNKSGTNKITQLPRALRFLTHLKKIAFNESLISDLSPISALTDLQMLDCSHTQVSNLSPIAGLTNLRVLSCDSTQISDLRPIAALANLQILYCRNTQIRDLRRITALTNLRIFDCRNTQVGDLSPIATLTNLQILDCRNTRVIDLSPIAALTNLQQLDCRNTQVNDLSPIATLTNLQHLDCRITQVNDLSPIAALTNLQELYCNATQVIDLSPIAALTNLQRLECSSTQISDLSPIAALTNLQQLSCSHTQISDLSPILPLIKAGRQVKWLIYEGDINVKDCPLIHPPVEIVKQGNEAIIHYFEAQEKQGENPLKEAKIVVVGAGSAGKTTLINKLQNPAHPVPNEEDKRTEGVVVTPLDLIKQHEGQSVKAYLWDLGGQELYHATHQFFLTPDTFYILLNDNRKNDTDFYYWLNILALRAGDECPIFCIFNQKENATRQISLDEHLFGNFPGLLQCPEDVDFADKDAGRFERLRATIETHFLSLPVLGKKFPAYWVRVRDALAKIESPYISWKQFKAVCIQQEIPADDEPQMQIVAQTLHNLGNLLWYPQVFGMRNWVILNPQWCLDAMYKVLDSTAVAEAGGHFDRKFLEQMWQDDSYAELTLQLEQLMRHFDLCYETAQDSGQFIAPQLLPLDARPWPGFPKEGCITFKHKYEFMPAGLMTRFIARMARYIYGDYVWRKGVTLHWDDHTYGEVVENPLEREITLRACGPDRKRRMNEMRQTLETAESLFRGLKLQKLVSCNCEDCVASVSPTTFDLKEVEDNALYNDDMICRNVNRKKVPAKNILDGIDYDDTPRIFISYADKNEDYKNEFRAMIAPLERSGQWQVRDAQYILPGKEWNKELMGHIAEANVIVLLLTPDFFNSEHIYNIELTRAVERHENGSALMIGVVVEDCFWEETPLYKVQMLPNEAIPVSRHPNRPEVWKSVAKKIQEAIAAREQRKKMRKGEDFER